MADETATKSGEEHVVSPPKVSKVKEISGKVKKKLHQNRLLKSVTPQKAYGKDQKAAPTMVINLNATKHVLLADKTATTSGEEHVTSPLKYLKSKKYLERQKNCTKTVY